MNGGKHPSALASFPGLHAKGRDSFGARAERDLIRRRHPLSLSAWQAAKLTGRSQWFSMVPPSQLILRQGFPFWSLAAFWSAAAAGRTRTAATAKRAAAVLARMGLSILGGTLSFEGWGKGGFYHNFFDCVTMGDKGGVSLLLREWIVPVGGSTPDRLRGGLHFPAPAGVDRSGRGCNPRPAQGGLHFSAPAGVDRSGRGFNPRPAQGGDSTSPPLWGWIVPVGGSTPDRLRGGTPLPRPCGGGSFRSGVQPPTGTKSGGNPRPAQSSGTKFRLKVPVQGPGSRARL